MVNQEQLLARAKQPARDALRLHPFYRGKAQLALQSKFHSLDAIEVVINTHDDPERGQDSLYLTVLVTSAENSHGGQVGRENRVIGIISLSRPMTREAAWDKNSISQVGKIYNRLAHQLAERTYIASDAVEEAYVWLYSHIG